MAWWWLLLAWPVVGLLAAVLFGAVVKRVPPDRWHELTPLPRAHLSGVHSLGLRRRDRTRFIFDHHDLCPELYDSRFPDGSALPRRGRER